MSDVNGTKIIGVFSISELARMQALLALPAAFILNYFPDAFYISVLPNTAHSADSLNTWRASHLTLTLHTSEQEQQNPAVGLLRAL